MADANGALEQALRLQQAGNYPAAEAFLREFLKTYPENQDGLHLLGLCCHAQMRHKEAMKWLEEAILKAPNEAMFLANAGIVALALGDTDLADRHLQRAVSVNPIHTEAYNNLALVRETQGRLDEAELLLDKAIALDAGSARAHSNRGNIRRVLGDIDGAIADYKMAIEIAPRLAAAHNGLGNAYGARARRIEAVAAFDTAIAIDPKYAEAYFNRGLTLAAQGNTSRADNDLATASSLRDDPRFRIARAGLLPVIPTSNADIGAWRRRFAEAFSDPRKDVEPESGEPIQASPMSFYLAYHGENNRPLIEAVARYYRSRFPSLDWTAPHCKDIGSRVGQKIRLGVVSRYFGEHAVALMTSGLLAGLPRDKFHVSAVTFTGDVVSSRMRKATDTVVVAPARIAQAREVIAGQTFDILLYADIGMEPLSYFLAFARLAPVQCVTWGHPDTTGLSTVDYYISNDLAEPQNGQDSYTEKLVRLEGVQSHYPRMAKPDVLPTRGSLGLSEEGTFYLCPQNCIKIHPDMDAPLAEILRRDIDGHLVLFEGADPNWTQLLLDRWRPVFGAEMDRVTVLPHRPLDAFLGVIAAADVVLDSWPFGAGNTNYQTFAMGVPVVTLPGRWIRGRGTLAHYTHMGFSDCVAATPEEYVEIAVCLGTDAEFRSRIAELIETRAHTVLEDDTCVRALAEFLESVAP